MKSVALALMVCGFATAQTLNLCAGVQTFGDQHYLFERSNGQLLSSIQFQHPPALSATDGLALRELKTILDAVDVKLILAPIPVGGLFLTDGEAPPGYVPSAERGRFNAYLDALNKNGITAVNLLPIGQDMEASGKTFIALRDHHWSSEGMLESAQKLAEVALASGVPLGTKTVDLTPVSLPYGGSSVDILVDVCKVAVPIDLSTFYVDRSQGELLGDEAITAVSTGDSSAAALFGLPAALSRALKTTVLDASIEGNWPTSGIMNYLVRAARTQARPNVIFWTAINLPLTPAVLKELKPALAYAFLPRKVVGTWDMVAGRADANINLDPSKRYFIGVNFTGPKVESFQYRVNTDLGQDTQVFARREATTAPTYTTTLLYELPPSSGILKDVSVDVGNVAAQLTLYEYPLSLGK